MKGAWRPARPVVRDRVPDRPATLWPSMEALELMVEAAWMKLPRAGARGAPAAVYLSPAGVHVGTPAMECGHGVMVGRYDQRIPLTHFREDVFDVNEKCRGRG